MKLAYVLGLIFFLWQPTTVWAETACEGRFVNPITDICWKCLFPISIGSVSVGSAGEVPDTDNPSMPLQICPAPPPPRFLSGLA